MWQGRGFISDVQLLPMSELRGPWAQPSSGDMPALVQLSGGNRQQWVWLHEARSKNRRQWAERKGLGCSLGNARVRYGSGAGMEWGGSSVKNQVSKSCSVLPPAALSCVHTMEIGFQLSRVEWTPKAPASVGALKVSRGPPWKADH